MQDYYQCAALVGKNQSAIRSHST